MTYEERISKTQKERESAQVQNRVKEARAKLDAKISNQEALLASLTNQRDDAMSDYPLNLDGIKAASQKCDAVEEEIEVLTSIREELFPSGKGASSKG